MNNDTITDGPDLQQRRWYTACHEIIVNEETFIFVIGGHGDSGSERSTEILSKNNYKSGWKKGNKKIINIITAQIMFS